MKEWIMENTSVSESAYDYATRYLYPPVDLDLNRVSNAPKHKALYNIENFTLDPGLRRALKYKVKTKAKKGDYTHQNYHFKLLSDIYSDPLLFSLDRYGKCAIISTKIACETSCDIVTGICTDFRGDKFVHTFLVYQNQSGIFYVFDYTKNLVMEKDDYYDLCEVEELKYIPNELFREYYHNLSEHRDYFGLNVTLFEFLCFPEDVTESVLKLTRK